MTAAVNAWNLAAILSALIGAVACFWALRKIPRDQGGNWYPVLFAGVNLVSITLTYLLVFTVANSQFGEWFGESSGINYLLRAGILTRLNVILLSVIICALMVGVVGRCKNER